MTGRGAGGGPSKISSRRGGGIVRTVGILVAAAALLFPAAAQQSSGPKLPSSELKEPFVFSKVDTDLLTQADLLDQRFGKDGLVYRDAAVEAYVDRVGQSILPSATPPERINWRFRVLRDPLANAFALPNGSIYVNSGLLALMDNDSQLAGVLAHEITHVTGRHGYLSNRSRRKKAVAIHVFQAVASFAPDTAWGISLLAVGIVAPAILVCTINGYDRELERQADGYAVDKLIAGGYDAGELASVFRLLQKKFEIETTKIYYNDHPKLEERVSFVSNLARGKAPPEGSKPRVANTEQYFAETEKVLRHNVQLATESGRHRTAVAMAQRLVDRNPKSSDNLLALADGYRSLGPRTPEVPEDEKGRKEVQKLKKKTTPAEEEAALAAKPTGQAAEKANQKKAEELYARALELDASNARAYRGQGFLWEKMQETTKAAEAFRKYLEMTPEAPDRVRIERRLAAVEKGLRPPVERAR